MTNKIKNLIETIVDNDYCIGCGACASIEGSPLTMKLNEDGKYVPIIKNTYNDIDMTINPMNICPFSDESSNEDQIGEEKFGSQENIMRNEYTGYYLKNFAGFVKTEDFREKGGSGGMGNWIAYQLLKSDYVDAIIHVKSSSESSSSIFEYQISSTKEELLSGSKSKYYPIEISQIIDIVKKDKKRYAVIGIPCYIKAVRLLSKKDIIVQQNIKYYIGLVCGHLKSDMFAKSMGWQLGIRPENLEYIDFRKKLEGRAASNYGVEVVGDNGDGPLTAISPTKDLYTTNWGHGHFKYNACEFCDDVLSETADITVGDAWLPEYLKDSKGTNVITVRNRDILKVIEDNIKELQLDEITANKVYQSQAGGFRHRREGLAYRLYLKDLNNEWRPKKRVQPSNKLKNKRKEIYEKRTQLSNESFNGFKYAIQKGEFTEFVNYMNPLISEYNKLNATPFIIKLLRRIKRVIR